MSYSAKSNRLSRTYDEVLYRSNLHREGGLRLIESTASLFGVPSVDINSCRVLELGCALGTTLAPQAEEFRESTFLGVDISRKQIDWARRMAWYGDLENVEFRCSDLREIDTQWGNFDYIICHGVYSWVDAEVQAKILRICRQLLSPNGIAMISYNTLPGWWFHRYLRDLLRFENAHRTEGRHGNPTRHPNHLLSYMRHRMPELQRGEERYFGQFIQRMHQMLENSEEYYIYHDFLEEENHPCYFQEFHERIREHRLHYVADVNWQKLQLCRSRYSPHRELFDSGEPRWRCEQLFDFIFKETFRASLLSRHPAHEKPSLEKPETIRQYYGYFPMALAFESLPNHQWQCRLRGITMPVSLPEKHAGVFVKVAKEKLGQFFSIDRLVAETIAQMEQGRAGRHELRRVLLTAMTDLARGGFLELSRRNPQAKRYNRRYPFRARPTLQYMLKNNFHQLPNLAYELVELPLEIQFLITQMDGRRSDVELAKSFLRWKNHQEGSHRKTLTQREIDSAVQWLSQSVAVLETLGFLESPPPRSLARNVEAA